MRILLDLDGVVTNWGKKYDELLDKLNYDTIPRTSELRQYNLMHDMMPTQRWEINDVMDTPGFYRYLEPIEGAVGGVLDLWELGHEIFFVTRPWAGNPACATEKTEWVAEHFGQWGVERLIITYDKTLVSGDILVDDKPNVSGIQQPTWKQILFAQPYNRIEGRSGDNDIVDDWADLLALIGYFDSIKKMPFIKGIFPEAIKNHVDSGIIAGTSINIDKAFTKDFLTEISFTPNATGSVSVNGSNIETRITSPTGGQKGSKLAQLSALDPNSIRLVAEVAGFGAQKYEKLNFMKGYDWSLSYDAAQRHQLAFWNGEDNDPESGLPHLAHAAWHMLAQLSFMERGLGTDDRYPSLDISQLQTRG
jgi:5'-nucleotidase